MDHSNCISDVPVISASPLCSFGVLADVHYADVPDGYNYARTHKRYYRRSLELVRTAVSDWSTPAKHREHVDFVLQLGDLIDGCNSIQKTGHQAVEAVRRELTKLTVPIYHMWGNHELYNFTRAELLSSPWLNSCNGSDSSVITPAPGSTAYYHFAPADRFRIVVLDTHENSMLGYPTDSLQYKEARKELMQHNKNDEQNSPAGLAANSRRFVKFNGGTSETQLNWLDEVLKKCKEDGEVVIVAGHIPILPEASDQVSLCWNYTKISCVLEKYSSCVLAFFAGHFHDANHTCDSAGIHHVVFPGIIKTLPCHQSAHTTVSLYRDRIVVTAGHGGIMEDIEMRIENART